MSDYVCFNVKPQPYAEPTSADVCYSTTAGSTITLYGNPSAATSHLWAITDAGTTGATAANLTNASTPDATFNYTGLSEGTVTLSYTVENNSVTPACRCV